VTPVIQDLGWRPLEDLIEEIYDGDASKRQGWPCDYWVSNLSIARGKIGSCLSFPARAHAACREDKAESSPTDNSFVQGKTVNEVTFLSFMGLSCPANWLADSPSEQQRRSDP
jgi:hypothetical protein